MEQRVILSILGVLIIVLLIATYFVRKELNKRRQAINQVPEEIIKQFELAERLLKESKGDKSPYEIMWGMANGKYKIEDFNETNTEVKGGLINDNGKQTRTEEPRIEPAGRTEADAGTNSGTAVQAEPGIETADSIGEPERRDSIQEPVIDGNSADSTSTPGIEYKNPADARRKFFDRFKKQ